MESLKPNEQRAKAAIILIWIVLILEITSLVSSYLQYDLLQRISSGAIVSSFTAAANFIRQQIIGYVYFIAYVISAITFIRWFRRAYFNLHLRVDHLSNSEGWAAGSWFVPIINFYLPYKIMKELYQETQNLLFKKGSIEVS